MCDKREYRAEFRRRRAACGDAEKDGRIAENALRAFAEKGGSFFVYLSLPGEADTAAIVRGLREKGKTVCVPRVSGQKMQSVPLSDKLVRGAFGVLQPEEGKETPCEVAFCPLLAFDKEGTRLGYGGGYYDRYLAAHPGILRVGLAYAGQEADRLPREVHDVRLDAVVTELGVRFFPPRNA